MTFAGLPEETLAFLSAIRANNAREWFDAHRADYQSAYVGPAADFVIAAGERLRELAPAVQAEPRVLGSIFRINRDTRFSNDKRPYKDHLDLWFWEGARKDAPSGFFFRLTPELVTVGVGAHDFAKERLPAYRAAVGPALVEVVRQVEAAGYPVLGETLKRTPPGVQATSAEAERLLRFGGLFTLADEPVGAWVHGPELLERSVAHWRAMAPLHRWLVDTLA